MDNVDHNLFARPSGAPDDGGLSDTTSAGDNATPSHEISARQLTHGLPVVVVLGATGVGKTAVAIEIASALNGEVVNADSRYLYRGMDVGTAKPSLAERRGVPHHLIDILEPNAEFSVAAYMELVFPAIEDIASRGHLPVVAGGTPQYLRALLDGWSAPAVPPDPAFRAAAQHRSAEALHAELAVVDPASSARIDPRNKRRLIRALEIVRATGAPVSARQSTPPPYCFLLLGLCQPRHLLYERVNARANMMFRSGWLEEVRALRLRGSTTTSPAMSAHGYREALSALEGDMTLDEAISQTQRNVRRYIRHQATWFRRFDDVRWFDTSTPDGAVSALDAARSFVECRVER